jgi:methylenetetrahydrofolate reductase (NADPH)
MRVIDHLQNAQRPLISFETIPPLRGGDLVRLLELIDTLAVYRPPFVGICMLMDRFEVPAGF